jgi:membrane protein DedA with SNARE-associated domain
VSEERTEDQANSEPQPTDAVPTPDSDEPATQDSPSEPNEEEKEWWDDPSMPWKHKPGRSDKLCLMWMGVLFIVSMIILPLRGYLMGHNVPLLAGLTGGRTATTAMGSLVAVGQFTAWWWPMIAGVIMSCKLDWVYWWAGKLWGRGMIEVWAGQSPRAAKNYARAERWANRWGPFAMFLAYIPIPLPLMAVVFVLAGASGMNIKKFVALDCAAAAVWNVGFFALGLALGEPAVTVLDYYAKIANYVAIGLVIFVFISVFFTSKKKLQTSTNAD